jgi:acyl-[acyl-carrier-protein]-phospholipid O-acyltransferase/long-chain-fatty-acid--[acyl-carrier-protein] ligase
MGLLVTQFLGAMNDNVFRFLIVPIGKYTVGPEKASMAVSVGLAMLVLPFILFAGPAGWLADRFSKRTVMIGCKVAEIVVMILGVAAILYGNLYVMYFVLFLMGAQSALFGPSKYGSIPELVPADRVPAANGLIGMSTILAIISGTVLGGYLYIWTGPDGTHQWWISAAVLVGVATLGTGTSLLIQPLRAAAPAARFSWNFAGQAFHDLRLLASHRPLFWAAGASALFWSLAGLFQVNIDLFATYDLGVSQQYSSILVAVLGFGVALGNVAAGACSRGRIELGMVFYGALGLAVGALALALVPAAGGQVWSTGYFAAAAALVLLGTGAGFYDVPLQSFLQETSPAQQRGAILAATSLLTFTGTVAASGVFYVLTGLLGISYRNVFLLSAVAVVPILAVIFWRLPIPTLRFTFWLFTRLFYRVRVQGLEHLPTTGGALLVANHVSWLDGLMLLTYSPRPIRMLAWAPYVQGGLRGWICRAAGVIAIEPSSRRSVLHALREAREAVQAGDLVCVFPEGGLTRTGQVQEFHGGFLTILKESSAPLVPIYLAGFWGSVFSYYGGRFFWKRPRGIPYPVSIWFGPPLHGPHDVAQVRQAVDRLGAEAMSGWKYSAMVLPRQFLRACRRAGRRRKVADTTGVEMTGNQLLLRTLVVRRMLRREILAPDERFVGLLLPPSAGALLANAALAIDHRVPVNLNYTVSSQVMNECIAQCGIRHVLTTRRLIERFPLKVDAELLFLEDFKSRVSLADKLLSAVESRLPVRILERMLGLTKIQPDDLLTVIFTSGSTGQPKGVMLSQANVGSNIESFGELLNLQPSDVLIGILPFFHSFGYTVTLWTALSLDPMVAYHYTPLEPKQVGQLCRRYGGTILVATPTFLRSYTRRCEPEDFATLDAVITGAEKLPPTLADEFEAKFGIRPLEGYGTTELSPVVSCNVPESRRRDPHQTIIKEGSVGRPIPGVFAKVVDLDTGEDLGCNRSGMLLVSGPNVMLGYMHREDLTDEVMRDGWYVTGDVSTIDEDGFITITGRQSRFSKIGGEMVPHIGVEESIIKVLGMEDDELPRVAVSAVADLRKGERLIILHTGLNISPEQVCRRLIDEALPPLWIPSPDSFYQVPQIPVLGTGKLDLKRLKELAEELATGQVPSGPQAV